MELIERLTNIFRFVFDNKDIVINNETTANDIEGWDSLNHVMLMVAIENEFKIRFGLGEVQTLKNVGELIALISSKVQK